MRKNTAHQKNKSDKFLFGAALSAHQAEGGNTHNQWYEFERKVLSKKNIKSGKAANHYELYDEDFSLAKQLGHNAHRFSIEWSRIEPEEGKINFQEIEHYRKVIKSLKEKGLTPILTLFHFTLPVWVYKRGGFLNKKNIHRFIEYSKFIVTTFKDDIDYIITINEPQVYAYQGYLLGKWPPQKRKYLAYFKILRNLAKTHKWLYKELKTIRPDLKISIAKNNQVFEPARKNNPFDNAITNYFDHTWNYHFLNKIKNHVDFIGLNYYFYRGVKFTKTLAKKFYQFHYPTCRKTDMDWEVYPKGIYQILKELDKRYNLPVMVTENGVADDSDKLRQVVLPETLDWVFKAKKERINVIGYLHWSLTDNMEWDEGFKYRFGLIKVDYNNYTRSIRPSALIYKDLIDKYTKEMEEK